jgi:phage-related baseplate assembly protein
MARLAGHRADLAALLAGRWLGERAEIEAVEMAVAENEDVRPLTDWPRVSATSCPTIDIDLTVYAGPDEAVVLTAAQQAVEAYREARASWAARSPAPGCSARRWSAGFTTR